MSFQENFLRLRSKSGYTQEDVARRLDASRQSVAKWEAGKSTPDLDRLIALADLFDVSLDELVRGKVTLPVHEQAESLAQQARESPAEPAAEPAADGASSPSTGAPPTEDDRIESGGTSDSLDKDAYLAHMVSFARKIGAGVGLIILGAAFAVLADLLEHFVEGYFDLIAEASAAIAVIGFTALGLAFLIPAGIGHADFQKRHPVLGFEFSDKDLDEARRVLITHTTVGISLILVGVIAVIGFSAIDERLAELGAAVLLVFVAVGVEELIYGGIRGTATEKREYEANAAEALLDENRSLPDGLDPMTAAKAQRNRFVGAICGIIMTIATAIGMGLLLVVNVPLFWLAWPIGGLTCGIVSLAGDALLALRTE